MGKLIQFWGQEKRLGRRKRLQWNRVFFLLGMIIIGSTYQFLRSHSALPTLWTAMYSQHPVKMSSRDLPSSETVTLNSDHQKSSLEMKARMLDSQVTEVREKSTPSATVTKKNLNIPRRIVNNSTLVTSVTPRRKKKNYTLTTSKQMVKNFTPTTFSRNVLNPTSSTPKGMENYMTVPKTTVKNNDSMTTRKTVGKKLLATSKRTVENIPGTPKGIVGNTPTILKRITENTVSPPPTKVVETTSTIPKRIKEDTPTTPKRVVENTPTASKRLLETTPTSPMRAVEKNTQTPSKKVEEKNNLNTPKRREMENAPTVHQMMKTSTMVPSTTEEKNTSPGLDILNMPTRARVLTSRTSSTRIMMKRTFTTTLREGAYNTTSSAMGIVVPTTQIIQSCVFAQPVPTVPASLSPSMNMTPFLDEASHSSPTVPDLLHLHPKAEYPPDLFSVEERRQGWVVLHVFGMTYVFVALAIVCDEYFVPALGVITDKLQISEDVAGATFMAAGGSAPELFTSLIGVFISHSNVGIGTIVGSAVFNILFVIGTCALFSREVLNLTWWPLFRDVSFYIFDLMMLILFFLDSLITWWESLMLLMAYAFYVFTMKQNQQLEIWVKEQLNRRTLTKIMVEAGLSKTGNGDIAVDDLEDSNNLKLPSSLPRGSSAASLHNSTIRSTIYQLMLHTLDPLGEVEEPTEPDELLPVKVSPASAVHTAKDHDEPTPDGQEDSSAGANDKDEDEGQGETKGEDEPKSQDKDESQGEREGDVEDETRGLDKVENQAVENNETEGETKGEEETKNSDEDETQGKDEGESQGVNDDEVEGEDETQDTEKSVEKDEDDHGASREGAERDEEGGEAEKENTGEGALEGAEEGEEDREGREDGKESIKEGEENGEGEEEEEEDDDSEDEDEEEDEEEEEEEEENEEPLSLEWPETRSKQAIYLFLLPIVFPLWLTIPDVRKPDSKKFFVITFLGSILWIAMFSYLMVWWAHQVGETIGISEEIMGLTILAAGTSIPDLITSVIVARKGLGDMAVSSSVGSNIFDITVGLPVPWFLFSVFNELQPVAVSSNGLFCAIVLLFLMLLFVISSIASCKWRMNKILGFTMFLLYFIFLIVSVMLEDRIISCPISI